MKKFITLLLSLTILFAEEEKSNYFVDNFLKYSTFYTSVSLNSPFVPQSTWEVDVQNGTFVETTKENELSYNISFGVRKLARFKYQVKKANFYDGSEKELSDVATIGNVDGWEYLLKYSQLLKSKLRYGGRIGYVEMPLHRSFQIDTHNDIKLVEKLLQTHG